MSQPNTHPPDACTLAFNYCRLGASDGQLAELFHVPAETLQLWMADLPDFAEAVRRGRVMADAEVTGSLHRRAVGFTTTEQRIFMQRGKTITVAYDKHHPPHVGACMEWLCNRRPQDWSRQRAGKRRYAVEEVPDCFAMPLVQPSEPMRDDQRQDDQVGKQKAPDAALPASTEAGEPADVERGEPAAPRDDVDALMGAIVRLLPRQRQNWRRPRAQQPFPSPPAPAMLAAHKRPFTPPLSEGVSR